MYRFKRILALFLCLASLTAMTACGAAPIASAPPADIPTSAPTEALTSVPSQPPTQAPEPAEQVLRLALHVLYNDDALGYYMNEIGPVIEVRGDGQYTVTFDCAADLSEDARALGIEGLYNLTAIYIKDYAVTSKTQKTSNVAACDIRWDSVTVNGQELTLTGNDFKSALKSSGVFDTNDPLNSWDGSAVEEVTVEEHVLNITLPDPQTITVTFTISGLTFQ